MRNKVISPRFDETEYKGQDVVHLGVRIPLQEFTLEDLWDKLGSKLRNKLNNVTIERDIDFMDIMLNEVDDLAALRAMWFDPSDPTFPSKMDLRGHYGIVARSKAGRVQGGILLKESGSSLFMYQVVTNEEGKDINLAARLIWEAVKRFHGQFHSIDVGVSYNPKRYQFFKQFAIQTYPIILKRPELVPVIRLAPFRIMNNADHEGDIVLSKDATFFPRGSYALYAALKNLNIGPGDLVTIVKTFGSNYISGCVVGMVDKTGANWALRELDFQKTKAVIAVHEFGIPVFQKDDINMLEAARQAGIPVIEDCAWRSYRVWDWSKYAVMSLSKMYPLNYGGLLIGENIPDDTLWSWGVLDTVKRERFMHEGGFDSGAETRKRNWLLYHDLVVSNGMSFDTCFDYKSAVESGAWVPTVYLQRFSSDQEADEVVARLEEFGVQAGHYHGEPLVFLPIHQNMTIAEVEYMFAVVAGYYNLCKDYGIKHKSVSE